MSRPHLMRTRTVYISGPMSGYPQFNFPAFDSARDQMRSLGFKVVSPADLERTIPAPTDQGADRHHQLCLRRDIEWLMGRCSAALYLPGHEKSVGAMAEKVVAEVTGLPEFNLEGEIVPRRRIKRIHIEYYD